MSCCQPLAWEIHSLYSEFREALEADLREAQNRGAEQRKVARLKARLASLPEEPEDGVTRWLKTVGTQFFKSVIIKRINQWFDEPPDWAFEDDYIPLRNRPHGLALRYFEDLDEKSLKLLGACPSNRL